jgi:hypothetical protein
MNNDTSDQPSKPKAPHSPKKVFDVMRPGKTPASATSRPVIAGHKPPVADDQFVPSPHASLASDPSEKRPLMDPDKKVGLNPMSDMPAAEKPVTPQPDNTPDPKVMTAQETSPELPAEAGVETAAAELFPDTSDEKPTDASSAPDTSGSEATAPAGAEPPATKPTPEGLAVERTVTVADDPLLPPEQEPAVPTTPAKPAVKLMTQDDVLADTGAPMLEHAVVSHHKQHVSPLKWLLIILLVVVIALVAFNFLLDAKVITTDFNIPHTNLLN